MKAADVKISDQTRHEASEFLSSIAGYALGLAETQKTQGANLNESRAHAIGDQYAARIAGQLNGVRTYGGLAEMTCQLLLDLANELQST